MMELELPLLALLTRLILSTGNNKIPLNILCLSSEGSLCKKALSAGVDDVAGRS